jgi:hypothetical protein
MKRIITVLAVAALMAVMLAAMAAPAFALTLPNEDAGSNKGGVVATYSKSITPTDPIYPTDPIKGKLVSKFAIPSDPLQPPPT